MFFVEQDDEGEKDCQEAEKKCAVGALYCGRGIQTDILNCYCVWAFKRCKAAEWAFSKEKYKYNLKKEETFDEDLAELIEKGKQYVYFPPEGRVVPGRVLLRA